MTMKKTDYFTCDTAFMDFIFTEKQDKTAHNISLLRSAFYVR